MLTIEIPGRETLKLKYLVLDFNGTLGQDGKLLPGIASRLNLLANQLQVFIISADTFGSVEKELEGVNCEVKIIGPELQNKAKYEFIKTLNCDHVAAVGNGYNDSLMLKNSILGLGVIQVEGASSDTIKAAAVVGTDIRDLLDLLIYPDRLKATLRN